MSSPLKISLLGPPIIDVGGRPIEVDTRKAIALLAYLAVEGETSRDILATLLWADASQDRARATLRRTLSSLRNGIGADVVITDRNRVALLPGGRLDLRELQDEIDETHGHGHDLGDVCPRCVPHLERATALYRGDFLQGFTVRDAPEFEDWVRMVAESFRSRVSGCFQRLAMARASAGDYAGAIESARRWIEIDELHEPAHRLLMLLHAWAGDRPGAVEAYRRFVAILDRELSVAPLEETSELFEAILDEDLPPAPSMPKRIKADVLPAPEDAMLDRIDEMAALRVWWDETGQRGRVVMVTGAPWMGKTRLLEELTAEVERQGHLVLSGRGFRPEHDLPYGVVTQVIRSGGSALRTDLPSWVVTEVSRLLPGSAQEHDIPTEDRHAELKLLEGVYEAIANAAAISPVLVVIDDAQWMDSASTALVSYVARRVRGISVMLVLAMRSAETNNSLTDLLQIADVLDLEPLEVEDIIGPLFGETEARAVVERTGGVPILVRETLDRGVEAPNVTKYLDVRTRDLSDLAHQVLTATAVLEGHADPPLLREVSGRSEDEVVEALEELMSAGLVRELADGGGLSLTLDSLQRTTYESTSLPRRLLLHRRAGEALAARPRAAQDLRIAPTVATQFQVANDIRAGEWYRISGDLARSVYANDQARSFYEAAAAHGVPDMAAVRLALGELAMVGGEYQRASRELTVAASLSTDGLSGRIEHRLGELHRLLGRFQVANEHYAIAVETHPQPATVYADWAMLHHRVGEHASANAAAAQALAHASEDLTRSRAENVSGVVAGDLVEALGHFDRALELAGDDPKARLAALNNKAYALAGAGEIEEAVGLVQTALELAASTGERHRQAALHNHLADLHHRAGRADDAQVELTRAVSLFADVDTGSWEPEVWLLTRW